MSKTTEDLKEFEKAVKRIRSVEMRQPIPKFTEKKLHSLQLRNITAVQQQFAKRLHSILLEPEPEEAFYQLCELYSQTLPEQRIEIQKRWNFN